ncbi:MAG: hypothetical protein IJW05_14990, partial [Lentisphaeria bacterium]|nr:hypothetical protein [Lentisphaeria bacterium]
MLLTRTHYAAPDEPYHYVGSKLKRFIVWLVIGVHVAVIIIPGLVMALIAWLKPQDVLVSKVVLVDSMPNEHTTPSLNPGAAPTPSNDPPVPPDLPDIPEMQEVPAPQPPQPKPVPPTPKPTPKPTP